MWQDHSWRYSPAKSGLGLHALQFAKYFHVFNFRRGLPAFEDRFSSIFNKFHSVFPHVSSSSKKNQMSSILLDADSTLYLAQMAWSQLEPTSWEEDSTGIVPACPQIKIKDCLKDAERLLKGSVRDPLRVSSSARTHDSFLFFVWTQRTRQAGICWT